MFDPTAFENMKVVIEGNFYDLDISGEIRIIDRNDFLNSAKLSRRYEVSFTDCINGQADIYCTFMMDAGLKNLAAELLPEAYSEKNAGCHVSIKFVLTHQNDPFLFQKTSEILQEIWGQDRIIEQIGKLNPKDNHNNIENESTVTFNRIITEEQIDDLNMMIDYMLASIEALRSGILPN